MGKYSPLCSYLMSQAGERVPMSFGDIEKLLGEKLPASKRYPAWWSNNPSNNPMTKEWLAAGFQTESVNIAGEKLVFRRAEGHLGGSKGFGESAQAGISGKSSRHPIFGCMKGTLTLIPDVDLTEPADPDWGKVYED
ncbi:DUF7662 domain-containing protein [Mesorhizobium sanjuanii]|uniref:DUF7662 domain-containing protein n=1 Tax=Mesorhizobium sanjuanii TaxID=2037900 RepID=UPI001FDF7978|nr:hypothetical protein [Mesorhizobium sanjuanii]